MAKDSAGKNYTFQNQYFVTPWDIQKYLKEFADEMASNSSGSVNHEEVAQIVNQVVQQALEEYTVRVRAMVDEAVVQARTIVTEAIAADNQRDIRVSNDSVSSGVNMKVEYMVEG